MADRIGAIWRRLREDQRLTQDQVAELSSVSTLMVGRYERGERYPTITPAVRISRALGYRLSLVPAGADCPGEIEVDGTNGDTPDDDTVGAA